MKTISPFVTSLLASAVFSSHPTAQALTGHGHDHWDDDDDEMPCGRMGRHHDILHDPDVSLKVTETSDGVTLQWTSKDPKKVKDLKEMGRHMKAAHELPTERARK